MSKRRQHDANDTLATIPWKWRDWRASKARAVMTPEARGVYRELLDALWGEKDCALPADDDSLAGLAGVTPEYWLRVRAQVLAWFDERDGKLTNPRALYEWKRARKFRRAKRTAGSAGGLRRLKMDAKNTRTRKARLAEARLRGTHTKEEWAAVVAFFGNTCVRCIAAGESLKDHIIPLFNEDSSDGIPNLQPLCKSCSSAKGPERIDHRINKVGVTGQTWEAFAAARGWTVAGSVAGSVVKPSPPSPSSVIRQPPPSTVVTAAAAARDERPSEEPRGKVLLSREGRLKAITEGNGYLDALERLKPGMDRSWEIRQHSKTGSGASVLTLEQAKDEHLLRTVHALRDTVERLQGSVPGAPTRGGLLTPDEYHRQRQE